jgi:hypothetical protein
VTGSYVTMRPSPATQSLPRSLAHSLTHSLFIHSFIHSHSLIHSLTHSLIHLTHKPLTHSLTRSHIHHTLTLLTHITLLADNIKTNTENKKHSGKVTLVKTLKQARSGELDVVNESPYLFVWLEKAELVSYKSPRLTWTLRVAQSTAERQVCGRLWGWLARVELLPNLTPTRERTHAHTTHEGMHREGGREGVKSQMDVRPTRLSARPR